MKTLILSGALALTLTALPALAQIDVAALSLSARAYDHATNWQERSFRPAHLTEVLRIPGQVLVDVRVVLDGPWSDSVERAQANARDIHLVLPDGTELSPRGGYQYWGQLSLTTRSISARRPRNFPTEDQDIYWNGLFVVPEGVTEAVLTIGGDDIRFSGAVTIPKISAEDDASAFARFSASGVRRFRLAELQDGRGDEALTSTIAAPPGMVLAEVEIAVTGAESNNADGDARFNWSTSDFRLTDPAGGNLALVGERFLHRILDSQFNGVDVGGTAERTVVWLVPEGLTEARLLFGETEVAVVDLGGAAVTETD